MADYITNDTELTSIANAIRAKGGTSAQLVYPSGFVSAIQAIETGGNTTTWETVFDTVTKSITGEGTTGYIDGLTPFPDPIEYGSVWRITYNGTPYICTAVDDHDMSEANMTAGYLIGNSVPFGGSSGNGEPFCAQQYPGFGTNGMLIIGTVATSGQVTIKVEKQVLISYTTLFDDYVYVHNGSPNWISVDASTTHPIQGESYSDYTYAFEANQTYRITWDGTTYICQTQQETSGQTYDGYYVGTIPDQPFSLARESNSTLLGSTSSSVGNIHVKIERATNSGGSGPTLISKTITANGTYDPEDDNADGYSSVIVNVQGGTTASWTILYNDDVWIVSSSPNYFIISDYTTPFQVGETYRITWGSGSTQYTSETIYDNTGTSYDGYVCGNPGIVGGTDTGEPYLLYRDNATRLLGVTNAASGQNIHMTIELQTSSGSGSGGSANLQAKTNISPTTSSQTITADSGYDGLSSVQINAMPSGAVTAPSSISGTSATVSTGTNTLTLTKSVSVTPNVTTAGYVSSGTAGNASVSLTASVTTKAAATITPSTSNQTITSGTYLTGTQTISGDANLVAGNIKSGTTIFGVTGSYTGSGGSGKNIQYYMGRDEISATSYTATDLSITVSKAGTYKCYWVMDRNTTSGTSGSQLYKNGSAVGSAHTSWTYNNNNRNGKNCEETLTFAANDVLVVRARSRSTSYICGVSNFIIVEQ